MEKESTYLTEREAMKMLRLSRSTIFKLRRSGMPYLQIGGVVRYEIATLQEWLRKTTGKNNEQVSSNDVKE